jgi:hypothetical protein
MQYFDGQHHKLNGDWSRLSIINYIKSPFLSQGVLVVTATPQQTMTWLQTNQFAAYLHTFASFSGADLMRMSRDDLIQICGLADGIRLFNALHAPPPRAK